MGLLLLGAATEEVGEALAGQADLGLRSVARTLLERMQDVDGLLVLRHVEDAMFHPGMDTDLEHARADGRHGFPITGHEALLHPPELIAGGAAGVVGKSA